MKKYILLFVLPLATRAAVLAQPIAVTEEEATSLGRLVETHTTAGNSDVLSQLIDADSFVLRMSGHCPLLKDKDTRDQFRVALPEALSGMAQRNTAALKGGIMHLLRTYEKDGQRHILFRIRDSAGRLNYQDFTLVRIKNLVKAADFFNYVSDEYASVTMANSLNLMYPGAQSAGSGETPALLAMGALSRKGDFRGAVDMAEKLPQSVRETRVIYVYYMNACGRANQLDKYQQLVEHYIELFPDAGNGYLLMSDLYRLRHDSKKGLVALNKLDSVVGGDPWLDYYRGTLYGESGKIKECIACFERAYSDDPSYTNNLEMLINAYSADRQHDKAKGLMQQYQNSSFFRQEEADKLYAQYHWLK
jgi:tetratricopeptide (TPR) repeat protein